MNYKLHFLRFWASASLQEKYFGICAEMHFEQNHGRLFLKGRRPANLSAIVLTTADRPFLFCILFSELRTTNYELEKRTHFKSAKNRKITPKQENRQLQNM